MKTKLVTFVILLAVIACHKVPVTGRKQLKLVPESMLIKSSEAQYRQMISSSQGAPDPKQVEQLSRVGVKIAAAVERYLRSHKQADRLAGIKWEFNVINNPQINAFCLPGGKVAFFSGIFSVTQTDEGVATVMGHEIAHAIARHGNERVSQGLAIQTGLTSLDIALSQKPRETNNLILQAVGLGAQVGIELPYSRLHETEADKLGMVFMAMAGYDPAAAIEFWKRMAAAQTGAKPPELLSTHPADQTRIKDLQKYLPKARKYYRPTGGV